MQSPNWLRLNINYLLLGAGIGIILSLLISGFKGEWIGFRSFYFQLLFSVIISLCITNSIYISQKLLKFNKEKIWFFILVYYSASLIGMLVAIETIYLVRALIFKQEYHFMHLQDIGFSTVLVVIICTIVYMVKAQKERLNAKIIEKDIDVLRLTQMKTQAELATLHSKINPHFLYNALNAIASLVHEDPDKAEEMTLNLSKLFRYSINQNQEDLISVQEELEIVNTYLDIEKVRFGNRIKFETQIDPELLNAKIPRFLIQPLVENALKHGLKDVITKGKLLIAIQKAEGLSIGIFDNGTPFPKELNMGYGLQSTYDKLGLLYGTNFELHLINHPLKQLKIQIPLDNG
ncbi:histidine kinase [Pedobacter sp. MC2016-14]|uniref:sensor histidine kinase n=1 Tax=Pedobacter sp. MC2016-14 TaxID=2897327 RepID=UPI001E3869CB|nr:histidine kinase [Pedobacter sp. MC2016-14]MCD0489837.1 histidine kinase [Pedobacter sp. MC2016-14]